MVSDKNKTAAELLRLVEIMETLRSPEGCPWDRKQTTSSLKPYLLEETYELLEAIDSNQSDDICDELGDLLLQIVFLTQIYKENNLFDLASVAGSINAKMIRRHPHVFAEEDATNHTQRWEQIKKEERNNKGQSNTLADRIPKTLPSLKRAAKVAKKAPLLSATNLIDNLVIEMQTLKDQLNKNRSHENIFDNSLGNMLYSLVQLCTALHVDAEERLRVKTKEVISSIDDQF